jgi:hypothetical protein
MRTLLEFTSSVGACGSLATLEKISWKTTPIAITPYKICASSLPACPPQRTDMRHSSRTLAHNQNHSDCQREGDTQKDLAENAFNETEEIAQHSEKSPHAKMYPNQETKKSSRSVGEEVWGWILPEGWAYPWVSKTDRSTPKEEQCIISRSSVPSWRILITQQKSRTERDRWH